MGNEYKIANIHAKVIQDLINGTRELSHINNFRELDDIIKYQRYSEESEIVQFLLKNNVNILPCGNDENILPEECDLRNNVLIREFINSRNYCELSEYIRLEFYMIIRLGMEKTKSNKRFFRFCQLMTSDFIWENYVIKRNFQEQEPQKKWFEFLNEKDNLDTYIDKYKQANENRWEFISPCIKEYCIGKTEFNIVDSLFGLDDLIVEQFHFYSEYISASLSAMSE
jgi:hypothetical protein